MEFVRGTGAEYCLAANSDATRAAYAGSDAISKTRGTTDRLTRPTDQTSERMSNASNC